MKGILFKPDMIRAIVEGRKTQTRRTAGLEEINKEPNKWALLEWKCRMVGDIKVGWFFENPVGIQQLAKSRYHVGETVYIKEAWSPFADEMSKVAVRSKEPVLYRLDYRDDLKSPLDIGGDYSWHSPMFLKEIFARYFILITDVRPERLQEITEEDAIAEGCDYVTGTPDTPTFTHINSYRGLWDSINKKIPWASNPWLWHYSFKQVAKES